MKSSTALTKSVFAVSICFGLAMGQPASAAAEQNRDGRAQTQPSTTLSTSQPVSTFVPAKPANKKPPSKAAEGK